MKSVASSIPRILCLIGSLMIFVNALLIANIGSAIVWYSSSASSINEIAEKPFWYRISFGIPSLTCGPAIIVWLVLSVACLIFSIDMFMKPIKTHVYSFLIIILSIVCLLMGGGFLVGTLLAVIGGGMGLQRRVDPSQTFVGKLIRAARLESKLFLSFKQRTLTLIEPVLALILINILSGLGGNIYTLNTERILSDPDFATKILLFGEIELNISVFNLPAIYIGLAIVKWIILSSIIFILATKLLGGNADFDAVARVVAFSYAPVALQVFIPFLIPNQPHLVNWPILVIILTNFWMIFALVAGIKAIYNFSIRKSLGVVIIGGATYWLVTYKFLLPIIFETTLLPGLMIQIEPIQFLFMLFSLGVLVSIFLGTFSER